MYTVKTLIKNVNIITPYEIKRGSNLAIENDKIANIFNEKY